MRIGRLFARAEARERAERYLIGLLPREWTDDRERRIEAEVSEGTQFTAKIALAQRMLAGAFDANVSARLVVAETSWRAMPTEYGRWETAYQRYRLWPRTLAALA